MLVDMKTGRPLKPRPTEFGQRLAELRQKAGLSQAQLGEKLERSQRAVADWEMQETTALRPEQIIRLAEVLGVSVEYLITGKEPEKRGKPGPKGQLAEMFEQVAVLSRSEQKQVVSVVRALIAQASDK